MDRENTLLFYKAAMDYTSIHIVDLPLGKKCVEKTSALTHTHILYVLFQ